MAVAFVRSHTTVSIKVAGTNNLGVNISTDTTPGNVLVAYILFDNAAGAASPTVSSIAVPAGETATWTLLGQALYPSAGTAGAFASGAMYAIRTTVPWPVASYTVTLSASVTMKATLAQEFSGALATVRSTTGTAYSTTTTMATATTTGTTPVIGDLAIGYIFGSNSATNPVGDFDSTGGSWSGIVPGNIGSSGGSAATNNAGTVQYKVLTAASHQTYANNAAMTAGNGSIVAILQQYVDPAITQAAYRFYADGTETGSTALAAQDAAPTVDVSSGDVNAQLRVRLQSTTAIAVDPWDDFQLQWEKNASGTWEQVATTATSNLTDGEATTNRLGAGTGTFYPGKVSEDGLVDNLGWSGNNYTELLYSLTFKQDDLANGDTLRFRVLRNGATTGLTYTQTPTVAITAGVGGPVAKPLAGKVAGTSAITGTIGKGSDKPKIETLTDTFDTQIDPVKWTTSGTVAWAAGRAALTEMTAPVYAHLKSAVTYDLTESSVFAQVTPLPLVSTGRETLLDASINDDNRITMGRIGSTNKLLMRLRTAAVNNPLEIAFDEVAHAWWRIGMTGTTVNFDTSPDGITWTNRRSVATTLDMTICYVDLSAGQWQTDAGGFQTAYFDNVNTSPVGGQVYPLAGTVSGISAISGTINLVAGAQNYPLNGVLVATSATTGNLAAVHPLVGTTAAVSGASGAVIAAYGLAGALVASTTTSGSIGTAGPLSGTVASATTTTGNPAAIHPVAGTTAGLAVTVGNATAVYLLAGALPATSATSGTINMVGGAQDYPLAGSLPATSTTAGSIAAIHPLAGTAPATSTTSGDPAAIHPVAGAVAGISTTVGAIVAVHPLAGVVTGTGATAGSIAAVHPLAGTLPATSATSGTINLALGAQDYPLAGTLAATSSTVGSPAATHPLATSTVAAITTTAGAIGTIVGSQAYPLAGTLPATSSTVGTLGLAQPVAGTVVVAVTTTTGTLYLNRPLAGTVAGTTTTATLTLRADLAATGTVTTSATVTVGGLRANLTTTGTVAGVTATVGGTWTATHPLAATVAGIVVVRGTISAIIKAVYGSAAAYTLPTPQVTQSATQRPAASTEPSRPLVGAVTSQGPRVTAADTAPTVTGRTM